MSITLIVTAGPNAGQTFTVSDAGTCLVGRAQSSHIQVPSGPAGDMRVSQNHFLIEYQPPLCEIHDLNSHNGTYVNGQKVQSLRLQHGDEIRAGGTQFRVELSSLEEETAVAPNTDFFSRATEPLPLVQIRQQLLDEQGKSGDELEETGPCCLTCAKPMPRDQLLICPECLKEANARAQVIPDYILLREIGRGSMGVVYLGLHQGDQKLVAIKSILPSVTPRATQITRFLREADILRQLDHPNIVTFRELGTTPTGLLFLVTDYIAGTDLSVLLKQRKAFKTKTALRIICQVLQALAYAHDKGFVHRDIKPSNLLLQMHRSKHKIKLTDFGLARVYQESKLSGVTLSGDVGGTPAFISPEQVMDYRNARPAADQYSAAATLYTLITGEYLYNLSGGVSGMLGCVLNEDPVPILQRKPDLDVKLAGIIHRALNREAGERFPHVRDFRQVLVPFAR